MHKISGNLVLTENYMKESKLRLGELKSNKYEVSVLYVYLLSCVDPHLF